jgi:hypothetical protein
MVGLFNRESSLQVVSSALTLGSVQQMPWLLKAYTETNGATMKGEKLMSNKTSIIHEKKQP